MKVKLFRCLRSLAKALLYIGIIGTILNVIGIPNLIRQLLADSTSLSLFTHNTKALCAGNFIGYVHKFAHLKNVIVDPGKIDGKPGGEEVLSVLNQPEYIEYFDFTPGFFTIKCKYPPSYTFRDEHHLNMWMNVLESQSSELFENSLSAVGKQIRSRFTIAITRYEYANLYHQIADIYNAYIMLRVFNLVPEETDILIVDGHPKSNLDGIWETLFGDIIRVGHLKEPIVFNNMVWNIQGYTSSIHQHTKDKIPEVPGFSDFVLDRFGVPNSKTPDCMDMSILFVWRRNYVAHPRNPSGIVARKVLNEEEVIDYIRGKFVIAGKPIGTVHGVHLESLPFDEQLRMIQATDILIGMHGAGLSHTLFLPSHAGLIEIFSTLNLAVNHHFEAMARWKGLHYRKLELTFQTNGMNNDDTSLEKEEIAELINEIKTEICQDL